MQKAKQRQIRNGKRVPIRIQKWKNRDQSEMAKHGPIRNGNDQQNMN